MSFVNAVDSIKVALIGGTGLDEMPGFVAGRIADVTTHFGTEQVVHCSFGGLEILFLPRHGVRHSTPPHAINYRAQIAGLKKLGVERIIGVCSVGSLTRDLAPGSFAVLTDFIDLTKHRANTFHDGTAEVTHTDFTHPYCPKVSDVLSKMCRPEGAVCRANAVYVGVEGPRYETPAEVRLFASWGGHVVGMTNVPEVILAREAGICYGALVLVTNFAAGLAPGPLVHDDVRAAMAQSQDVLRDVLATAIRRVCKLPPCTCSNCTLPPETWD